MLKVSVIIPTYNRAAQVVGAIDSVLAQTYGDYEIIVVDDGSIDATQDVLEQYGSKITYLFQDNKGEPGARNTGVLASRGEYLVFLDSDDTILPQKLETQVSFLDSHPEVGVVYSDVYVCDEKGSILHTFSSQTARGQRSGHVLEPLTYENFLLVHSAMTRRECLSHVGLFDESLDACSDWDLWIRLAEHYVFQYQDIPLARYVVHEKMASSARQRMLMSSIQVRHKVHDLPLFQVLSRATRSDYYYAYGRDLCLLGQLGQSRRKFLNSCSLNRTNPRPYLGLVLSLFGERGFRTAKLLWESLCRQRRGFRPSLLDRPFV